MPKPLDFTGLSFGRLTVVERAPPIRRGGSSRTTWLCECECGRTIVVITDSLKSGNTRSCGCLHAETREARTTTHGMSGTKTYDAWCSAKSRCSNPNNPKYADYGGRGISMCAEWFESFEAFLSDMGPAPNGLELDRIDNDGNYEPGNCRWTTRKVQMNNRRVVYAARQRRMAS